MKEHKNCSQNWEADFSISIFLLLQFPVECFALFEGLYLVTLTFDDLDLFLVKGH
jgi:hypothetical protein